MIFIFKNNFRFIFSFLEICNFFKKKLSESILPVGGLIQVLVLKKNEIIFTNFLYQHFDCEENDVVPGAIDTEKKKILFFLNL